MKAYAKINTFLKIVGLRDDYHELNSRFILFEGIFDEVEFINKTSSKLVVGCDIPNNIIERAKNALIKFGFEKQINEFFSSYQVKLTKNIPMGAGLGGGSSDAGAFLRMTNEAIGLNLNIQDLIQIASQIGADVAFFVSGAKSANVSGIGEVIEVFEDEVPQLEVVTSDIFCSTPQVYKKFRSDFLKFDLDLAEELKNQKTSQILKNYSNLKLNDLLAPCKALYPNLKIAPNEFLSGSGSSKFKVKQWEKL